MEAWIDETLMSANYHTNVRLEINNTLKLIIKQCYSKER